MSAGAAVWLLVTIACVVVIGFEVRARWRGER
jgi:hypothetical protein